MLSIYASAIKIATGQGARPVDPAPRISAPAQKWLPKGHWWLRAERSGDKTRR